MAARAPSAPPPPRLARRRRRARCSICTAFAAAGWRRDCWKLTRCTTASASWQLTGRAQGTAPSIRARCGGGARARPVCRLLLLLGRRSPPPHAASHARSRPCHPQRTVESMAEDVRELLDHLGLTQVAVMGASGECCTRQMVAPAGWQLGLPAPAHPCAACPRGPQAHAPSPRRRRALCLRLRGAHAGAGRRPTAGLPPDAHCGPGGATAPRRGTARRPFQRAGSYL